MDHRLEQERISQLIQDALPSLFMNSCVRYKKGFTVKGVVRVEVDLEQSFRIYIDDSVGEVSCVNKDFVDITHEQQNVCRMIQVALITLCKTSLRYRIGFALRGVLRVVLDSEKTFKIYINETVSKDSHDTLGPNPQKTTTNTFKTSKAKIGRTLKCS